MRLSREAIQRMVGDRVGGGGSAGGGGGISMDVIQGMGFATQQWVNEKYLSIDFFNRLFQAYDSEATPNQVLPNDLESTITNIKAMFGLWTEQFVSALGYGPGGGGGGDTLTEPLASINNASLGMPTAAGQVITWNGSEWIFDIPQGGGGGGTGTVTSITAGTGLSGGTITTMGTIAISSAYQGYIAHGETAYGWGNHANAGYLTSSDLPALGISNGVITIGSNTITPVTQVAMSVPTGFTISGSPVTKSGTLALGIASGYFMPTTAQRTTWNNKQDAISDLATIRSNASHGETAYGWGNHADAGYLLRTEGMRFITYDNYVAARFVTATGEYDDTRAAKAQGDCYIEWWSTGGYFNHEMGFIRAKGNITIGTGTSDTTHYLQIGGGRLFWDNTNNALYVQKADGTACHLYATGGVSALGMSVGGTPSMNALTLQNLTVNGSATIGTLVVTNDVADLTVTTMNIGNELWLNGNSIYMDGGNIEDASQVQTTQMIVGSGGSTIKKIYWDGTYLQVQIGTTTYKFRPDATA